MSVIDEIKQKTDIVEVIGQYTKLTKAGRTFRGLCPLHSEKHPSFFVYPEQQSWHCFGACNTGGDVFSFIMKKENIDFGEVLRLLADRAGVKIPSKAEPTGEKEEKERLYQVNDAAALYFQNLLLNSLAAEKVRNYLASRGVSAKAISDFQLGYSLNSWDALKKYLMERGYTEEELLTAGLIIEAEEKNKTFDRFRSKLMFPIKDNRGRTIGFGARVLDDSLPKYVNSPVTPIFDKSSSLYGIDKAAAAIRKQDMAVIVEGYMDTIIAHQYGFSNVIASMGTSVTEQQMRNLKKLTRNVTLALDADAAGEEAMLRSVSYENILENEIRVIILPSGKDPDDVIKEDTKNWQSLVDKALPVVDFTFNMVAVKYDLNTARGKSTAADELLRIIVEIKEPVRQAHYLQKLARLVNVSESRLETAMGKFKPTPAGRPLKEQETVARKAQPILSSPPEEYCLALLLQHPELKNHTQKPSPEYFENSENREIFTTWEHTDSISALRDKLDSAIWEHLDSLVSKSLLTNQIEQRYTSCLLRLKEKYLRNLEAKKGEVLALEAQSGGTAAELAKLKEQGIDVSVQLGKVFTEKGQLRSGRR